jgi:hypothetical protein
MDGIIILAITYTVVAGFLYFLLLKLPLDMGEIRTWGLYVILAVYVALMLFKVLIPLVTSVV